MEYQIALPPDLDVGPAGFAEAWNETPECRAVAEARVSESTAQQYDPTLAAAIAPILDITPEEAEVLLREALEDADAPA